MNTAQIDNLQRLEMRVEELCQLLSTTYPELDDRINTILYAERCDTCHQILIVMVEGKRERKYCDGCQEFQK